MSQQLKVNKQLAVGRCYMSATWQDDSKKEFQKKFDKCFLTMILNNYLPDSFIFSSIIFYERMNRHERMNIRMNTHVFGNPMVTREGTLF